MLKIGVNIAGFNTGWFAGILGAAAGLPWLGPLVVLPVVVGQALWSNARVALAVVLAIAIPGTVLDSALTLAGVYAPSEAWADRGWWIYPWFAALWLNFAATIAVSYRWLRGRHVLSGILGAIFGPLTYLAGARLGALDLGDPEAVMIAIIAVEWLIAMPAAVWVSERVERRLGSKDDAPSKGTAS